MRRLAPACRRRSRGVPSAVSTAGGSRSPDSPDGRHVPLVGGARGRGAPVDRPAVSGVADHRIAGVEAIWRASAWPSRIRRPNEARLGSLIPMPIEIERASCASVLGSTPAW